MPHLIIRAIIIIGLFGLHLIVIAIILEEITIVYFQLVIPCQFTTINDCDGRTWIEMLVFRGINFLYLLNYIIVLYNSTVNGVLLV
jgi:hypothetical protein